MKHTASQTVLAALCVIGAMALFGLIDNFMGLVAEVGGLWQFHLLRSAIALGVLACVAWLTGAVLWPRRPAVVLGRNLLSGTAMVIYFGCLGYMPIAQAVAGLFTAPIFVVLISVLVYRERIGSRRISAVALGFVGIIMVLRPDAQGIGWLTILPVLAGVTHAMGNIVTRKYCADEDTFAILGGFFSVMLCVGAVGTVLMTLSTAPVPAGADGYLTRGWVWPEGIFLTMIIVQGVGSLIGVGLIIRAYQIAEASSVAVFENAMLVFATLWGIVLWGDIPDALGFAGLGAIALAAVIITRRTPDVAALPA